MLCILFFSSYFRPYFFFPLLSYTLLSSPLPSPHSLIHPYTLTTGQEPILQGNKKQRMAPTSVSPAFDKVGYWSPNTSSIDWCENNYTMSYYIAEYVPSFPIPSLFFFSIHRSILLVNEECIHSSLFSHEGDAQSPVRGIISPQ